MSPEQPSRQAPRPNGSFYEGRYSSWGLKSDELGNGSRGRCTAEGTVLEIRLTLRMVVMRMVGRSTAGVRRAELHQERSATRRHEAHWDIGAKDERGQQYDGQHIGSPGVTEPSFHDWGRHHARVSAIIPVANVAVRCCISDDVSSSVFPAMPSAACLSALLISGKSKQLASNRREPGELAQIALPPDDPTRAGRQPPATQT